MADDKPATFNERFYFDLKPPVAPVAPPVVPEERFQYTTVLDPGHGDWIGGKGNAPAGFDPGYVREMPADQTGKPKKVEERALNLSLGKDVQDYLKKRGFGISKTHDGLDVRIDEQPHDKGTYNQFRTDVDRHAGAFVSIHNDSNIHPETHGIVIHYNKDSAISAQYAKALAAAIGHNLHEKVDIHQDDRELGVLMRDRHQRADGTEQPAVLIEATNMNNDRDIGRVLDASARRQLVSTLGDAIVKAQVAVEGPIARIVNPNEKVPLPRPRPREI